MPEPHEEAPEFAERLFASMRETFWDPEIERRGGLDQTGMIRKALAILQPGRPVEIRLNDECVFIAQVQVTRAVAEGEPVTAADVGEVDSIEPQDVDPNAGWVAYLVLPDGRQVVQFDFVRNRAYSSNLLSLAGEYLETARGALEHGRARPAIENSMAAAELAITAQTFAFEPDQPLNGGGRNSHSRRLHWTRVNSGLGNTVSHAHDTLQRLNKLRNASRYGEGDPPDLAEASELCVLVMALVDDAEKRVHPLRESVSPASDD